MTRKHFRLLAEALYRTQPKVKDETEKEKSPELYQWESDVYAIAKTCRAINPFFDYAKFYKACDLHFD